jgi:hypothetical protein
MTTHGITTSPNPERTANQATDGTTTTTITRYQELAAQFMSGLDALTAATIPGLEMEHATLLDTVRGHQTIPDVFLGSSIAAVEQTPEIQAMNTLDVAAGHDVLQFIEAFRPVLNKVAALGRNIKFTMSSRKAALAADALRVYDLAKSVARDPRKAPVFAHVKIMKRDLNRNGRRKKKLPPLDVRKATKAAGAAASAAILAAAASEVARAAASADDQNR